MSTNTSTSEASQFSFIIPYNQTQACDIYGPLCQTGSITVGVNLTSKISTTVLPCSSYLTAQSSFLASIGSAQADSVAYAMAPWPTEWWTDFGRSPACRSYAQGYASGQYTASICGGGDDQMQIPPTLGRYWDPDQEMTCCGNCTLEISEVRLYYFPDRTATECHQNQTSNSTSAVSNENLRKRVQSLLGDGSIAVLSGHTLYVRPYVSLCL